jgi:signal transduction histidine kinase
MNILQGLKKSLEKTAKLEEDDVKLLNVAIEESRRMKNLIHNLQDFNKPSPDRKVRMDVHGAIDTLLLLCKSDFKRKGISVIPNYAEELPQIKAIPDQMKQVFLNLLTNAADACQAGGEITISTCHDESKVAVSVKDNGIGIEPEKIDVIFEPFYTSKPGVEGTGLGLSVCRGIVQAHNGEIHVESQPGKGSNFTVLLPISG